MSKLANLLRLNILRLSLLIFFLLIISVELVSAGTNLIINCQNNGPCDITPDNTPLFAEIGILPGDSVSQNLMITNLDSDESCNLSLSLEDKTGSVVPRLADRLFTSIYSTSINYFGTHIGSQAESTKNLTDLLSLSSLSLGSLPPSQSRTITWLTTFDPSSGNEYQQKWALFDLRLRITCDSSSSQSSSSGGGSSSSSSTPPASSPVCNDSPPIQAPVLSATSIGSNQVRLNWSTVSPVTHYALVFYRVSDGASYGSNDVGNVDSYLVNNLSAGQEYNFEIFGVNGCAPGPRSNLVNVAPIGAVLSLELRPTGEDGQVLGTTEENSREDNSQSTNYLNNGAVAGEQTMTCEWWQVYLPWWLLIAQIILIMAMDYQQKKKQTNSKHWLALAVGVLIILVFYWLRTCYCYTQTDYWLLWLCKWFWIVSLSLTLFSRLINYAFIEEVFKPESKSATD